MQSPTVKRLLLPIFALAAALLLVASNSWSAPTKVGNGDDGGDLEGAAELKDGAIAEARAKAAALLRKMNTRGISGLGTLIPEVEGTRLYLAKRDTSPSLPEDQGAFHSDMRGLVFARTFAEPHAPTRFFPIATKLDEGQLIALHVHEGLHRALPASMRESEPAVTSITLAITSPEANHDRIREVVARYVPQEAPAAAVAAATIAPEPEKYPIPENARIRQPSVFGYTYRYFKGGEDGSFPVGAMHSIHSYVYPFGSDKVPLGVGIEASMITRNRSSEAGPLGISARMRLWSGRGFDVGSWATASLNMLSSDELKHSAIGRDVLGFGLSMRKDASLFYNENLLGVTLPSESTQRIGSVEYLHSFGKVISASSHFGASLGKLKAGLFGEVFLADYYRVDGGEYHEDKGRYRIVSGGPELGWYEKSFSVALTGRFILNSTQGANFDFLGNIMGQGAGQGSLAGTVAFHF